MKSFSYRTHGTCAREIRFELDNGIVKNVNFIMGCQGNTTGVSKLIEGMDAKEAISRLEGINCGGKGTSCPDQLAQALKAALEQQ